MITNFKNEFLTPIAVTSSKDNLIVVYNKYVYGKDNLMVLCGVYH